MTIAEEVKSLMDDYWDWLKDSTYLQKIDSGCMCITTPFLDHHNDNYQIYVSKKNGGYELTDDSYIITDLKMSGCDISGGKRQKLFESILKSYGVGKDGDQLKVYTDAANFPSRKHDLLQAMQELSDLYYTSKSNVSSMFYEDVSEWLMKNNIPYTDGMTVQGNAYNHHIDFALRKKELDGPRRVIRLMDRPAKDKLADILLIKSDVPDLEMYILINDKNAGEKNISDLTKAGESFGMKPILWSKKDDYVDTLS